MATLRRCSISNDPQGVASHLNHKQANKKTHALSHRTECHSIRWLDTECVKNVFSIEISRLHICTSYFPKYVGRFILMHIPLSFTYTNYISTNKTKARTMKIYIQINFDAFREGCCDRV